MAPADVEAGRQCRGNVEASEASLGGAKLPVGELERHHIVGYIPYRCIAYLDRSAQMKRELNKGVLYRPARRCYRIYILTSHDKCHSI